MTTARLRLVWALTVALALLVSIAACNTSGEVQGDASPSPDGTASLPEGGPGADVTPDATPDATLLPDATNEDAGVTATPDAAPDATLLPDAPDAATDDTGPSVDSGAEDAPSSEGSAPVDGGSADAADGASDAGSFYGPPCTVDTDCPSQSRDCQCGASSGSCASSSGHCGAGMAVFATPNGPQIPFQDAGGPQTFTLPAGCTSIYIEAWGAAGGWANSTVGYDGNAGGAGGFVGGSLTGLAEGAVVDVWVGQAGLSWTGGPPNGGAGWQAAGTPANGGNGTDTLGSGAPSDWAGGGGGLTTITVGSTSIYAGAGAGASYTHGGQGGGAPGAIASFSGISGSGFLISGGGAPAGLGASNLSGGVSSAPPGFAVEQGETVVAAPPGMVVATAIADPPNVSAPDHISFCSSRPYQGAPSAGQAHPESPASFGASGSACVVLRCE